MRYVKWSFWTLVSALLIAFLHYTLPQHDIVRIVGTDNRRVEVGDNSLFWSRADVGMANSTSRDVFFINAVYENGKTMEYRNEDTGWGWPPYFKVDTFGLQTQAKELTSTPDKQIWVSVTHYGWRNKLFTIFPNAVGMKQVDGPNVMIIPWVNIIILGFMAFVILMIRRMWLQFRERMVDPAMDKAGEAWDSVDARADAATAEVKGVWGRFTGWLGTWTGKPRK
ncbi:MAG: DUF1523 family protein [Paracoccaceae bacterium]|jgi:hypothetical protein